MRILHFSKTLNRAVWSMCIALTLGTITISCLKEEPYGQDVDKTIIEEYRTFYDLQMGEIYSSKPVKEQNQIPKRSPKWEEASMLHLSMGNGVVAPLEFENQNFVSTTFNSYDMSLEEASYLMMYKDKGGTIQGEIVYLLPEGKNPVMGSWQKSGFCGTIIVQDLKGDILKGYISNPDGTVMGFMPSNSISDKTDSQTSKSTVCFTFEIWQTKSSDGGTTWSSPELISTHTECYSTLTRNSMAISDGESGGGGFEDYLNGGGNSGSSPQNYNYSLKPSEMVTLNEAKNSLASDCAAGMVISNVWGSLNFRMNSTLTTNGSFDAASNTILFRNTNNITFKTLLEELFHAYQHTYYPSGIRTFSKGKSGWTNIEFEAKVFYDIYMSRNGVNSWLGTWGFPNEDIKEKYRDWIEDIVEYGPTAELMGKYNDWLNLFNTHHPHYKGYMKDGLNATGALLDALSGCN